jgi:predicted CxxxxCH...CXXCH cytochrome family protein
MLRQLAMALVLARSAAGCTDARALSAACTTDCMAQVHPRGILDPASPDFHVRELERRNWDFPLCAACHGGDFSGGVSRVSCLTCHVAGPTACVTCHSANGPTTNAHPAHVGGGVACAECHIAPASWDDDGHILHAGAAITSPAPVVFRARAALTLALADRAGPPAWDGATCSNVYCHGAVLHAAGGTRTAPRWDDTTPTGGCTTCHGAPPPTPSHAGAHACSACHPSGAAHIDGIVEVGRAAGCSGCHGSAASPAPPTDLAGNTFTTALGVGAHQAHLQGRSRISAPVACATCHVVPAASDPLPHTLAPGPAAVTSGLGWERGAQTCATSYCHGAARPRWTSSGEVSCGSCHGIPPAGAPHSAGMALITCAICHAGTVDAFGNIIVTNGTSEHINGHVDLQ